MPKKKYRRYSPEFKRHALKRASEDGITDKAVCAELAISERLLRCRPRLLFCAIIWTDCILAVS